MSDLINIDEVFDLKFPDKEFQTSEKINPRAIRAKLKRESAQKMKEKEACDLIDSLPKDGEAIHIVSAGIFDYWTLVPVIVDMLPVAVDQSRFSTWAMTMPVCSQFVGMIDDGLLGECGFLADRSLQRMQGPVYAQIASRFTRLGYPFRVTDCHAKIALLKAGSIYIAMEGSANFTNNPRIEQICLMNSKSIYDFHYAWLQELFDAPNDKL